MDVNKSNSATAFSVLQFFLLLKQAAIFLSPRKIVLEKILSFDIYFFNVTKF